MGLSDHVTLIQHFKDTQVCISIKGFKLLCSMVCTLYDTDQKTCVLQMKCEVIGVWTYF